MKVCPVVVLVTAPTRLAERVRDIHAACVRTPDIARLSACDIVQAIPQTEVWVAIRRQDDGWAVGPAKFCGHEISLEDYPRERARLRAGEASRLARRWGKQAPAEHPAYAEVEHVAQSLGAATRRRYVVVVLGDAAARRWPQEYDLHDLVAGITDDNRHEPADFGRPLGHETW